MARVLITGAAGFLGSHLCDRFIAEGDEVLAMDNLITGNMENLEHLVGNSRFTFFHQDVSNYVHVSGSLDYILHFASPASPIDYLKIPIQTLKVSSLGTHNLLGLALEKRARILVASTSEVYGDPKVHPQTEEYWGNVNPVGPRRPSHFQIMKSSDTTVRATEKKKNQNLSYLRVSHTSLMVTEQLFTTKMVTT